MAFDKLRGQDPNAIRAAGRTDLELRRLKATLDADSMAIARGTVLGPLQLTTTPLAVPHGLNREWIGAFLIQADTAVGFAASPSSDDEVYVELSTTAAAEVYVWVF